MSSTSPPTHSFTADVLPIAIPKHQIDISQLPSIVDGSLTSQEESLKRRKTCRFIEEVGRSLKLPRVSIATAMVFFHRFYAKHSFSHHDRFEVAVAAILLAAKVEESPKKLVIVLEESYKVKIRGMQAGRISQATSSSCNTTIPLSMTNLNTKFDSASEDFVKLKERILLLERIILHTIGFELSVDHPYKFLVDLCKKLTQKRLVEYVNYADNAPAAGNPSSVYANMLNSVVQCSMNFANDSMQTSLCLQFVPQKVATACVYLACHFCQLRPVASTSNWSELLGQPDIECLASIVVQIMELVTDKKGVDNILFDKIKKDLEDLKLLTGKRVGSSTIQPNAKRQRADEG